MNAEYEWDGDWRAVVSDTERTELELELCRELAPSHVLSGATATAIARRWRRDDTLFRLQDGRFAQVHLTRHVETDPRWPDTQLFESFAAWKAVPVEDR